MKKIIVLTSNYPAKDLPLGITPVVHMFVQEWKKMGIEVIVIHNLTVYPAIYYWFSNIFYKIINNAVGSTILKKGVFKEESYKIDNVQVVRIPILKYLPHFGFSEESINKQSKKIIKFLNKEMFKPDIIIGHWVSPQLKLCYILKKYFGVKSALVLHEVWPSIIKRDYGRQSEILIKNIDYWGFRSTTIMKRFEIIYGKPKNGFLCYSGINKKFISNNINKNFSSHISSFIFVGNLINRKHPEAIINALQNYQYKETTTIHYVGEGAMDKAINILSEKYKMSECIKFHGRINHDKVRELLKDIQCFIMISEEEAFGLVYIEAMASGCITIASKNEGFDGIIEDGKNGFLCKAGDFSELELIISKINSMSTEEKIKISSNAILTAQKMTESITAIDYLKSINLK